MATLFILVGIPSAGKTTWAYSHLSTSAIIISKDIIRWSLSKTKENEPKEIYKKFYQTIQEKLYHGENVCADATHLTPHSRRRLLNHLQLRPEDKVIVIQFDTPFEVCLLRNEKRDKREKLSIEKMKQMNTSYIIPSLSEGFDKIFVIDEQGNIKGEKNDKSG